MQRVLAIASLTWRAAFRFRLFLVMSGLLLAAVVLLPVLIKDDGTARGFTQILLTYTLSVISAFLGLSTLWLACGTLARDVEECQIQMLAVKPVARWQIWLGKWLGIVTLNAALLALAGVSVYGLLQWRAKKLPEDQQRVLQTEVLVARGSVKMEVPESMIRAETESLLQERLRRLDPGQTTQLDLKLVRQQIQEQIKADLQVVPPGGIRRWVLDLGLARHGLKDQPLFLRVKFNAAQASGTGTFVALWQVGEPDSPRVWRSEPMSLAPDTYHEFEIPPNLFDEQGRLSVFLANANDTSLLFPLDEGLEVLFPEGGFAANYARGLGVILCWLALLAALGLASASFLSFPVAAFFSLGLLVMVLASGTLANAVSEGTVMGVNEETGVSGSSVVDVVAIPLFKGLLSVINLVRGFSPVDALSTGRSIPWSHLGMAVFQIVVIMGGVVAVAGVYLFGRRELATAQGTQ